MFIFGCVGSSFLCEGFLQLRRVGATLHRGVRASHYRGLSCCGAEAPDAQAQQLWLTGPVAPRHVGSSQTRARTRVPRIGRQTLNHCATREAPFLILLIWVLSLFFLMSLANGLSILFIFSKNHLLVFFDLCYCFLCFYFIYFCSDLYDFFPSANFGFCLFFFL